MSKTIRPPRQGSGPRERERWEHIVSKLLDGTYGMTDLVALVANAETRNPDQIRNLIAQLELRIPDINTSRIHKLESRITELENRLFSGSEDRLHGLQQRISALEMLSTGPDNGRIDIMAEQIDNLEKELI